jgi:hypothetical protein
MLRLVGCVLALLACPALSPAPAPAAEDATPGAATAQPADVATPAATPPTEAKEKEATPAAKEIADRFERWRIEIDDLGRGFEDGTPKPLIAAVRSDLETELTALRDETLKGLAPEADAAPVIERLERAKRRLFDDAESRLDHMMVLVHARPPWFFAGIAALVALWLIVLVPMLLTLRWSEPKAPAEPAGLPRGTVRSLLALSITWIVLLLAIVQMLTTYRVEGSLAAAFTAVVAFYFGSRALEDYLKRDQPEMRIDTTTLDGERRAIVARTPAAVAEAGKALQPTPEEDVAAVYVERMEALEKEIESLRAAPRARPAAPPEAAAPAPESP